MSQSTTAQISHFARRLDLPRDECLRLLASPLRRSALTYLAIHEEVIHLEDLANMLAESEDDIHEIEPIAIRLHHVHLPMMAASNILTYDSQTYEVDPVGVPSLAS